MSLLNEMLKDLNQNKVRVNATPLFLPLQNESFLQKLPRMIPWLFVTFIISLLILLIIHGIGLYQHQLTASTSHMHDNLSDSQRPVSQGSRTFPMPKPQALADEKLQKQIMPADFMPMLPSFVAAIPEFPKHYLAELPMGSMMMATPDDTLNSLAIKKTAATLSAKEWYDLHLNEALQAIEEGEEPHAMQLLNMILVKFPAAIDARESLAALYLSRADFKNAMNILEKGLSFEPDSPVLIKMKSRILFEQDKTDKALALLSLYKPDIRIDPDYYGLLAAILQSLGQESEAGDLYKKLVEIEPANGQYWLGYGIALEQKQALQQATAAYQYASQSYDVEPMVRIYAENRLKILQG